MPYLIVYINIYAILLYVDIYVCYNGYISKGRGKGAEMKYDDISGIGQLNATDAAKVDEIAESIKSNGWKGAPILVCNMGLVTGSHRLAALNMLDAEGYDGDAMYDDIAEDVTDEINAYCGREGIGYDGIEFDRLRTVFAGTWVEEYKDQIVEW